MPPALKRIILRRSLHGPKGPFFHRFFALKREENRCVMWQSAIQEEPSFVLKFFGGRAAIHSWPRRDQEKSPFLAAAGSRAV
jgi:hypothetical protein